MENVTKEQYTELVNEIAFEIHELYQYIVVKNLGENEPIPDWFLEVWWKHVRNVMLRNSDFDMREMGATTTILGDTFEYIKYPPLGINSPVFKINDRKI